MAKVGSFALFNAIALFIPLSASVALPAVTPDPGNTLDERASTLNCPSSNGANYVASGKTFVVACSTNYAGNDMSSPNFFSASSLDDCISRCSTRSGCVGVAWQSGSKSCYLKAKIGSPSANSGVWAATVKASSASSPTPSAAPSSSKRPSSTVSSSVIPSKSATPSPVSYLSGKRGLAYNDPTLTQYFGKNSSSHVSWSYNWDQVSGNSYGQYSKAKYIPMLWSNASVLTSNWATHAQSAIAAGADALLSFNEPDQCGNGGSCMGSAAGVAAQYKQWMQPLAGKALLGAPAVTNGGSPMGLTYLQNFISNCSGCQIDFVTIHWYDSATNIDYFKSHVQQAYAAGGNRPVWITEFAGSGTVDQQVTFLKTVMPWLDSLSYVKRYAYFMDEAGVLVTSDGSGLSQLGQVYDTYSAATY